MRHRTGLTLIELTAAMAIAGMLMTATLGVSARLASRRRAEAVGTEDFARTQALGRLLEADVLPARRYRINDSGLWLETWSRLDRQTSARAHLPTIVNYEVRQVADDNWLVRLQQSPDDTKVFGFGDLVCRGVRRISLVVPRKPRRGRGRWRAIREVRKVSVEFDDDRPAIEMVFRTE